MFAIIFIGLLMTVILLASSSKETGGTLDRIVDKNAEVLTSSVQELVRVGSVAGEPGEGVPFGPGPRDALVRALDIAKRLGFATKNLDNYAGYAEFGNGDEYVAALGHVDVVPEGDNWTYPPFGGEIHDGKIYGRGALDDKGPALAALFGARAVMESGLPLSRRVRVIFGADEETGDFDMIHYLSKEKPPVAGFTPDADFPVVFAEKGILWVELEKEFTTPAHGTIVTSITGGTAVNMVPDAAIAKIRTVHPDITLKKCSEDNNESCTLVRIEAEEGEIEIHARGESAHASKPEEGKNAIQELISFLANQKLSPGGMTDALRFFCRTLGKETDGKSLDIATRDDVSGALTLNVGMIDAGVDHFRLTLDVRYPVSIGMDLALGMIREKAGAGGFSTTVIKHQSRLHYPPDSELVTKLVAVYQESTGDKTPPVAIGGGTYARRMPNTVAFGPYRHGVSYPIHKQDECIAVDELVALAKIYARAIYELAK